MMEYFSQRFGSGEFIGEHLWLGNLGTLLIVLSFCASLLSFLAYFAAEFSVDAHKEKSWRTLARAGFITHGVSVLLVFVLLFLMILNHWFEYHYAWRHSSTQLPMKYIISSFWEGQEGSFLLWQFWLVIMGFAGIKLLKSFENPVMGIVAVTQFFLGSMVLGIFIGEHRIGSNPFVLLRNEMSEAPIFSQPNYLSMIQDGNGLNPLLQNYWMTIHPPVLFLGFASVTFPFAFAIASLLRKDWSDWVKPALPWTLFSIAILGTGILMGGAWAYESLSFGGFWAWDPVENMSLVPWLMVVAGLHMLLVYRYTKHSLISTYVFFILGFVMVLYSTFLTRSGILGDTSVHAFTDLGMTGQLLIYMVFFVVVAFTLLFIRVFKKQIPVIEKEEELKSREFLMFIGTLVLFLSALQMIFTTSIPVWNIILEPVFKSMEWDKLAPPENVVPYYNRIQIWIGILAGLLTGAAQYFAYKTNRLPGTFKWSGYSLVLSVLVAVVISLTASIEFTQQHLIDLTSVSDKLFIKFPFVSVYFMFLVASLYAVIGNAAYMLVVLKNNWRTMGGSITHFGFGVFLLGVLISQGKQEVISLNRQGINFGKEFNSNEKNENILLLRDSSLQMGSYEVTYLKTRQEKPNTLYDVKYVRKDSATGKIYEEFVLSPNAQINPKMGLLANPDTKHYLSKDVFTHVTSVPDNTKLRDSVYTELAAVGDTFFTANAFVIVKGINPEPSLPADFDRGSKIVAGIDLQLIDESKKTYVAQPVFVIDIADGNNLYSLPDSVTELGLTFDVLRINPEDKKITLNIREQEKPADFIIMKAIIFPWINLVWLGGIITFAGALFSMFRRLRS
jgi:cytochrome c-type biogenesis protein CcmF